MCKRGAMSHHDHSADAEHDTHAHHDHYHNAEEHADTGHHGHAHHGHGDHGDHVAEFRRLFWINLILGIPVVAFSPMFASLLGYSVPSWVTWIAAVLASAM